MSRPAPDRLAGACLMGGNWDRRHRERRDSGRSGPGRDRKYPLTPGRILAVYAAQTGVGGHRAVRGEMYPPCGWTYPVDVLRRHLSPRRGQTPCLTGPAPTHDRPDPAAVRDALARRCGARRGPAEGIVVDRSPGGMSDVDQIVAAARLRAGSTPPASGHFTSLPTSFPQFKEGCAASCDRMTYFIPRGLFHSPTYSTCTAQIPTAGGGDGG